ncbi:MAG TPA: GHMP kinase [Methanoculleus sp.]|nr:GHMP kinase [Methanoculleus sp.]
MGRSAVAFSPGHISGTFRRVEGPSYRDTGSIGTGIVIDSGVTAHVREARRTSVVVHEHRSGAEGGLVTRRGSPPVEYALARMGVAAEVTTTSHLPAGSGFGLSAAALLSSITAADALFSLGMGREAIVALAHECEIVHASGLGDVAACAGGGLVCRRTPGPAGDIVRITGITERIFTVHFGPLNTADVLARADVMERVERAFLPGCPEDLPRFFTRARAFACATGLVTPAVDAVLAACDGAGVFASMTMLGNGVFASGSGAEEILSEFGIVHAMGIADTGFCLKGVWNE